MVQSQDSGRFLLLGTPESGWDRLRRMWAEQSLPQSQVPLETCATLLKRSVSLREHRAAYTWSKTSRPRDQKDRPEDSGVVVGPLGSGPSPPGLSASLERAFKPHPRCHPTLLGLVHTTESSDPFFRADYSLRRLHHCLGVSKQTSWLTYRFPRLSLSSVVRWC